MSVASLKKNLAGLADACIRLAEPNTRTETALELARIYGASDCVAFILDQEINRFLLAPGFTRVLRNGEKWQAFLKKCVKHGRASAAFGGPDAKVESATGLAYGGRRVLVFFHSAANEIMLGDEAPEHVQLLFHVLEQEHLCNCLNQEKRAATERVQELEALTAGLEQTRTAVSAALMDAKVARSRSENILETITDAFIAVDNDASITYFNRRASPLLGKKDRLQLIGHSVWEELAWASTAELRQEYASAKSAGATGEFEYYDEREGRSYQVYVYPSEEGASLLFRDVTKRKEMEALVRDLSTPVLHVEPHLLLLPVIGRLDRERALQLVDNYMSAIRQHRAKAGVMDLTGVFDLDRESTDRIRVAVQSARLLGCATILVGIAPNAARAFIQAGLAPQEFNVELDLESGIRAGRRLVNTAIERSQN